ncbi:MAG: flagellin [Lachnospiraceae bacterium]|nr:flagellin [Lachnospiraceae bacterium]
MKINSNIQALVAQNVLRTNEEKNSASTEKLSSGFKLNHAKDSPAGMAISNRMHAQIRSLYKAKDNASNAVNVVQTADGALGEVHNMLQRMNELCIKSSTGTLTSSDREAIQKEVDALRKEIERIAKDTEYNTQNLLGGYQEMKGYTDKADVKVAYYDADFPMGDYKLDLSDTDNPVLKVLSGDPPTEKDVGGLKNIDADNGRCTAVMEDGSKLIVSYDEANPPADVKLDITGIGGMKIQVGSASGQEIRLVIPKMYPENIGIEDVDVRTEEGAKRAIEDIAAAIEYVSSARSTLGAYQNRLETTVSSLSESVENLEGSYSTIKDIDMAEEMVEYTKLQVLVQAGTSMLAQANEQPQQALQLLQ